jgi:SAM-dependent methyltransferase
MADENAEQIEHWNAEGGSRWVLAQARMDALFAPLTRALLERAAPRAGERIVDVGCGCGDSSLALAALGAEVLGVDVSEPMLQRARERGAGQAGLRWLAADAADHPFEAASFDLLLSRFGVMFFADPVRAFANLRRSLTPDGRVAFSCWQAPVKNPWLTVSVEAVRSFAPETEAPAAGAPGPFAFADAERVTGILTDAGFHAVKLDPLDVQVRCGEDLDDALELVAQTGPASRVLSTLSPGPRQAALEAIRAALRPAQTSEGVMLGAGAWLVTARAGAP